MAQLNTQETAPPKTAQSRYEMLKSERDPFLVRARDAAKLTVPALMPPDGSSGSTQYHKPYQSLGARGVNNLAAKLLLALFPPQGSFFRLTMDDLTLRALESEAGQSFEKELSKFEAAFSKIEKSVTTRMEQRGARTVLFESLKQVIVCGNVLIQVLKDGALKAHRLDRYVVKRDQAGTVVEMIVVESLSRQTLEPKAKAIVEANAQKIDAEGYKDVINIYTRVYRDGRIWRVYQEVCDTLIPGTAGTYPLNKCAFLPIRWSSQSGEDYGRGFVEEHQGDLDSYEAMCRGIVAFSAAASKILFFVASGGLTSRKKVAEAPNLAVLEGEAKDISILQVEKLNDFQVVKAASDEVKTRLQQAFLLLAARDAERVTAEEIRMLANELETALGGVYSVLAQELQRPLADRQIHQLQKEGVLPALPEKSVQAQIVTGLDGLGRSSDLQKLDVLIAGIAQELGPEAVSQYVKGGELIQRRANALGVDIAGLIRSEDEVAQMRQQQAAQQLAEKLGPTALKTQAEEPVTQ